MAAKGKSAKIDTVDPIVVEAVRRAVVLYELLLKHATDGGKVILQEKTGYQKELVVR